MTIKDECHFAKLVVPVKKVMFQGGYFHWPKQAVLRMYRDKDIANCEAYRLNISREGIEVHAKTDAGAYYAVQTLRELVAIYGKILPVCKIEDEPDFRRRGVYLDC